MHLTSVYITKRRWNLILKIKLYDKVLLKDGRKASIVEILGDREAFIADIDIGGDYDTDTIMQEDIKQILE